MAVEGGNWQIFAEMVERSGAIIALNTAVVGLEFDNGGPKYLLQTSAGGSPSSTHPVAFDNIIIATPYQFSDISVASGVLQTPIEQAPYVHLHVTLFTSARRLRPGYFKWPNLLVVPAYVLTTLAKTDTPNSGPQGVGKAGFFSINIEKTVLNPATQQPEYVYKVFTPEPVTPQFLRSVKAIPCPTCFCS